MKRIISMFLAICLLSAVALTFTTPAKAFDSQVDGYVYMITPYYDQCIEVTQDSLTKLFEVTITYEGHYIFQTFGNDMVYGMKLYTSYYSTVKYDYGRCGFEDNCLIGVYLTPGVYYLEITYYYACDSRFSITYANDYYYGQWDSDYRLYLQDYDDIEPDTITNMGATYYADNDDMAFVCTLTVYQAGTYMLYVEGDASAVGYLINPLSAYPSDSTIATYYSPGEIEMIPNIPYYLVVHLNGLYGEDPAYPVESITVWAYLVYIG